MGQKLKASLALLKQITLLAAVFQEAKKAKEEGKEKVILVNWSGHGLGGPRSI